MPVYQLAPEIVFPPVDHAEDGLLAVGGDLRPERLVAAYANGVFPWPHQGYPMLWFSPDPRFVLRPSQLHVARSLRKTLRKRFYDLRMDTAFAEVMEGCARAYRGDGIGTWITDEMKSAYCELHRLGFAHSVEAWRDGVLVGGLYGVSLGGCFTGESMFTLEDDASKAAFVWLVRQCEAWNFDLIDCQTESAHLARFGAQDWSRGVFIEALRRSRAQPTRRGRWSFDEDFDGAA